VVSTLLRGADASVVSTLLRGADASVVSTLLTVTCTLQRVHLSRGTCKSFVYAL